jgi:hypothetical protein
VNTIRRTTIIVATVTVVSLLGAAVALACNLGGWLTVTAGPQDGQLTVKGGAFPPGDVLIRSGNTSGPVIAEAVADDDGRFEAQIAVPDQARSDTKILAEPGVQLDAGSRVYAWTFIGAEALEPPAGISLDSGPIATGLTVLALLVAAGLWLRTRRNDGTPGSQSAEIDAVLEGDGKQPAEERNPDLTPAP